MHATKAVKTQWPKSWRQGAAGQDSSGTFSVCLRGDTRRGGAFAPPTKLGVLYNIFD